MGDWLHSAHGQRYLNAAEKGKVDPEAIAHAVKSMSSFGMAPTTEGAALEWAARNLPQHTKLVSDMVARSLMGKSSPEEWRKWTRESVKGVGPAKSGFIASLLGRGDQPVADARQLVLNTGLKAKEATNLIGSSPVKQKEALERLAARQTAMGLKTPKDLSPFYQSLAHHTVWDRVGGTDTTHQDVMSAMQHAANGGMVSQHPLAAALREVGLPGLHDQERPQRAEGGQITGFPSAPGPAIPEPPQPHDKISQKVHVGPIHSPVAGRTDHLPMHVPSGAYVIPADIIGAMGEGNTMAGFKVAKSMFSQPFYGGKTTGGEPYHEGATPYGQPMPHKAAGGATTKPVPIVAAGGEYVIHPRDVARMGRGSLDDGHKILDEFVKQFRAKTVKTLERLPGPSKD